MLSCHLYLGGKAKPKIPTGAIVQGQRGGVAGGGESVSELHGSGLLSL